MKIEIEISDELVEYVIRSIMENFPEASQGNVMYCVEYKYKELNFSFVDTESSDERRYRLNKEKLMDGFKLMFTEKYPKGCTKIPLSNDKEVWENWLGQSDATDFDAFVQLAALGDVIYG